MRQNRFKSLALFLLGTQLYANNVATTIVPDRPGFSTGTYTVAPGKVDMEIGYDYSFKDDMNTQTLPLLVARTGLTSNIEFDIMWDGVSLDKTTTRNEKAWNKSVTVGGKYRILENSQYNFTFLGLVSVPIENNDNIDLLGGLLWDYMYSDDIALFGTLQASSYQENDAQAYDIQIAVGSSFSHTDKLSTFIEFYTIVPLNDSQQKEEVFDAGVMYLLSNNIQVDVNFGIGLNKISNNFIGAGFAIQF